MIDDRVGVFRRQRRPPSGGRPSAAHTPRAPRTPRATSIPQRARGSRGLRLSRFLWALGPMAIGAAGFLAGTARLLGAYSPFGIVAVGAAAASCNSDAARVMPAIAGALIGSAFAGGPVAVMALSISSALLLALPGGVRKWTGWLAGTCVFFASGTGAALAQIIAGQGVHLPVVALSEAALAGAAAAVIVPAALAWQSPGGGDPRLPSRLDVASLLLGAGIACAGLDRISFSGVSLGAIAAFYLSAVSGIMAGPGAGAIAGGAAGLAMSAAGDVPGAIVGAAAAAGAVSGIVGRRSRGLAAPAILLSAMFFGRQFGTPGELTGFLIEASMAAVALMATPARWVGEIAWRLPLEAHAAGRQDECRARVHHLVYERLLATARVFQDLSLAYGGAPFGAVNSAAGESAAADHGEDLDERPRDIASSVAAVRARACSGCASYNSCWKELFFRTYREIVDALALAELFGEIDAVGLPRGLVGRCSRREALARAAACVVGPLLVAPAAQPTREASFSMPMEAAAAILSLQTAGVAHALTRAAFESQSAMASNEEAERAIRGRLKRAGIETKCVSVSNTGRGGLQVQVVRAECDRACECAGECVHTMAPAVSGVVGRSMLVGDVQRSSCAPRRPTTAECSVRLLPACRYALETEALSVPRTENDVSGDYHSVVSLGDGRVAVLISDGMGVGRVASAQSQAAVSALARLLQTGLDAAFAVETVNALMSVRPASDPFATLDVVVVDLYSGDAEMIKAGAPPAYIRRGSRVTAIGAPSAPAGVSIPARTASFHHTLEEGDIIVLATDGVTEGQSDLPEVDAELARVIQRAPDGCPSSVAQTVMNWARAGTPTRGGGVQKPSRDDMTVFVARLAKATADARMAGAAGIDARVVETSTPEGEVDEPQ